MLKRVKGVKKTRVPRTMKKTTTKTTASQVKAIVNQMMDKKIEDKQIIFPMEVSVYHNSTITPGDLDAMLPIVSPGVGDFQRVGVRISPKSLVVRGTIYLAERDMDVNHPIEVRLLGFTQNDIRNCGSVASINTGNLLRGYSGATTDYDGTIQHQILPMNNKLFKKIFDKKIKLSEQISSPSLLGTDNPADVRTSAYHYSFKVKCPKVLKYDGTDNYPNNFAPFMAVGYCYLDGTLPDSVSANVYNDSHCHLIYEDA